jgi:hypothetical protein
MVAVHVRVSKSIDQSVRGKLEIRGGNTHGDVIQVNRTTELPLFVV